jgi:hypothetical protein
VFIYLWTVIFFTSRSRIFHWYREVIITGLFVLFIVAWAIFQLSSVCHHYWWKGCKIEAYARHSGPWADKDLYRASPAVTRDLGFTGLIRRTAPFSHLFCHTRGRRESILTRILTGHILWENVETIFRFLHPISHHLMWFLLRFLMRL